jgi:hypothetical protein
MYAGHNTFPDEFPFELSECREDVQQQPGGGVVCVG